jgi:hypothetical protein
MKSSHCPVIIATPASTVTPPVVNWRRWPAWPNVLSSIVQFTGASRAGRLTRGWLSGQQSVLSWLRRSGAEPRSRLPGAIAC